MLFSTSFRSFGSFSTSAKGLNEPLPLQATKQTAT
jgi:hypothetical protein